MHNDKHSTAPHCAQHPYAGGQFVATKADKQFGKLVCPKCQQFIAWVQASTSSPTDQRPLSLSKGSKGEVSHATLR